MSQVVYIERKNFPGRGLIPEPIKETKRERVPQNEIVTMQSIELCKGHQETSSESGNIAIKLNRVICFKFKIKVTLNGLCELWT